MRTENDVRAALNVLADDAPDAAAILCALSAATQPGLPARRAGLSSRRTRLAAPIAAAAAVVAIVATAVTIATGARTGSAPGEAAQVSGVPPYYVAIMTPPGQGRLVTTVRDTRSGATLATVQPPTGSPWFIDAAAGHDADSFVLAANRRSGGYRFYLLRFNPANRATRLIRLPIPAIADIYQLTLSPGGTELAVGIPGRVTFQLRIYALSGRLIRQWQDSGNMIGPGPPSLSWAASGFLALSWAGDGPNAATQGIRLIRATAPSGSLIAASRLVLPLKTAYADFVLSGDGATIAVDALPRTRAGVSYNMIEEFSTATGKLTGRYWRSPQENAGTLYWSNWTGSKLIVIAPFRRSSSSPWQLGILAGGKYTPLPTPAGEWVTGAF